MIEKKILLLVFIFSLSLYNINGQTKKDNLFFGHRLAPISEENIYKNDGYYIWDSSIIQDEQGIYHLVYSRWSEELGFQGWLIFSEIVHAVSDSPIGPWEYKGTLLKGRGSGYWDALGVHNPMIAFFDGKYYLYYNSTNLGSESHDEKELKELGQQGGKHPKWGNVRNNQRIGVAVAESFDGPWERMDEPLIEPAGPVRNMVNNPTITKKDDLYYLIFKGDKPNEKRIIRDQAIAISKSPAGPFEIQDKPVIDYIETEDMAMWYDTKRERFYAVFHAFAGFIGMVTSTDGKDWKQAAEYIVLPKRVLMTNGEFYLPERLERPFVVVENDEPHVLVLSAKKGNDSHLIFIPVIQEKDNTTHTIIVSDKVKQTVKFGVDAERLWDWDKDMKEELAHLAVSEINSEYIRVGIDATYEREEGVKNKNAYDDEIEMMRAIKSANPDIQFFASPRPLFEAYSRDEREIVWGHKDNTPWSPYPRWILDWKQDGTKKMKDGTVVPRWKEEVLQLPKLIQYFADYLNLMHHNGFKITYLDVTNEKETISPAANKYIHENLPKLLEPGVYMPGLVVPSSWAVSGATDWLDKVDTLKNEHASIAVAATHNTGPTGVYEEFVKRANKLGIKEIWNTEMHGWTGVDLHEEIITSEVLWKHLRAGFTGIDTWLFYGPAKGRGHTMIWVDHQNKTYTKSGKYEIFKQVVNHASGGNYVEITMPYDATPTAAFIKDNILSVWVLNKSKLPMHNTRFDLGEIRKISNDQCEVYRWHKDLPRVGEKKNLPISQNSFHYTLEGESLYFFKIQLD